MTRTTAYREMLYDIDGVRVVERRVPLWLQESYEIIPSWPEGEPVPHLFPPKPARGPLSSIYHHLHTKLADTPSPPNPPQVVTQLANSVRSRLETIYNTSFSLYHVVRYSQSSSGQDYGEGTLYTITLQIAPSVDRHNGLMIKIFKSVTDVDYLVQHTLD